MNLNNSVCWTEWFARGQEEVQGPLQSFLSAIVARQPKHRLPPFPALVDLLQRGAIGGGMGGGLRWDASAVLLERSVYEDFDRSLPADRKVPNCPARRYEEWRAWCAEQDSGIDYAQHLALLEKLRAAEIARDRGGEAEALAYMQAVGDYLEFISSQGHLAA